MELIELARVLAGAAGIDAILLLLLLEDCPAKALESLRNTAPLALAMLELRGEDF
jgi:hypothetical protein